MMPRNSTVSQKYQPERFDIWGFHMMIKQRVEYNQLYSDFCQFLQILLPQKGIMLKQKSLPKKKKSTANLYKNVRSPLAEKPYNFLFKFTDVLLSPKASTKLKVKQTFKAAQSSTATPSAKSRKVSKENMFHTAFCSKKSSEVATPFEYEQEDIESKARSNFRFLHQIGSGGFGRVWKVEDKKTGILYAMKEISKAKVIAKKSVSSIMNEKQLLDELGNQFIINSCASFQDRENLYLTMEYLRGGDLRYHMCFYEEFNQEQTKFLVSCIVLGLEYIHSKNIIHRDLKPENIVFEENGYARITDFGVARKRKDENSQQTSGTPGYMSPQVICRMNHSFEADFFALGVIVYQLMFGTRPYMGETRKQIREKILTHQVRVNQSDVPAGWSLDCVDFVNRLLRRNKESRLGYNGIQEIKTHPWLRSINWKKLGKKQLIPPFSPGIVCETKEYQRQMESSLSSEPKQEVNMLLRTNQVQRLFKNYQARAGKQTVRMNKQSTMYRR